MGLAIAEGDGAGLVEQQHVNVARGLDEHDLGEGQDVAPDQPVHTGDPDCRQQGTDRGRDEGHQEGGGEGSDRHGGAGVVGERPRSRPRPGRSA